MANERVVVLGLGYVGLPTAALLTQHGMSVHGVEIDPTVITNVNKGDIHSTEPELAEVVRQAVERGDLVASPEAVPADVFMITVPTPVRDGRVPDVSYVEQAVRMVMPVLRPGNLVNLESTSPVGTTARMADLIVREKPELAGQIRVAYCPERVLPGNALYELKHNARVIGGIDSESTRQAVSFYSRFVVGELHATTAATAEMCKLTENSYRDVNLAFANELSMLCHKFGVDVSEVITFGNMHPRVNILQPSCGVGGHCVAVDPWFIVHAADGEARLIETAREVNDRKPVWVAERIAEAATRFESAHKRSARVACLGLTFKPDIDDLRHSPALTVVETLLKSGRDVMCVEPHIQGRDNIQLVDLPVALKEADIIAVLVSHSRFRNVELPENKVILDFCGILRK
jgi:UDP-N-acetyl-D-mannosaminuronic acid dehydrogenase